MTPSRASVNARAPCTNSASTVSASRLALMCRLAELRVGTRSRSAAFFPHRPWARVRDASRAGAEVAMDRAASKDPPGGRRPLLIETTLIFH